MFGSIQHRIDDRLARYISHALIEICKLYQFEPWILLINPRLTNHSDTEVGLSAETIHSAIDAGLTEQEFEVGAASSYAYWIEFNDVTNLKNAPLITITSGLLILGILSLSLGVYDAIIDYRTTVIAAIAYIAYLIMMYFTGIASQVSRWASVTDLPQPLSWLRNRLV